MPDANRRAALVIASVALVSGVAGAIAARGLPFTAPRGALVGSLMAFNLLGAIVTIALAGVAMLAAWRRGRVLLQLAGDGFGLAALLQLVQLGRDANLLGGRASTFSFFVFAAVGIMTAEALPRWRASA